MAPVHVKYPEPECPEMVFRSAQAPVGLTASTSATARQFCSTRCACAAVGADAIGYAVTGAAVTGDAMTGDSVTGDAVTGDAVIGDPVTGDAVLGGGVFCDVRCDTATKMHWS